jgi:N-acetylmuramoyl-L-alanine amidase
MTNLMQKLENEDIENRTKHLNKALIDNQRKYPVDYLIIHHSAGNTFKNATSITIQDAFDRAGWARGYKPINRLNSFHSHPQIDKESFAMAHFALHEYTIDKNIYDWRLVPLISDWWNNVCWHAGNWEINQRSIGIEICGNYENNHVDEKALRLIADYFKPHYLKLKALNIPLKVCPHSAVSLGITICPGKITEQISFLKNLIFKSE